MDISSVQNPRVKRLVKLREDKKARAEDGLTLVEGFDEMRLALAAGHTPQTILFAPELTSRSMEFPAGEHLSVSRAVFEKISYRQIPDGSMGVFPIPRRRSLVIVAEAVEKPGNLGAILRSADAAGVDALLVCDARVDVWNPNVIRASRGTIFSVPLVECDNASALEWLRRNAIRVVAATPAAETLYTEVDLRAPSAIAVGAEAEGLSDFWMASAGERVKIPMMGKVNSLNVSVSAALIVYEALRQRSGN